MTSSIAGLGRFQIVVDHPPGERYDRAVLRVGVDTPPPIPTGSAARSRSD